MSSAREDGHCYRFAWIRRSAIPIFLLIDHCTDFLCLAKKWWISIPSRFVLQNAPSNSVLFSSSFICATVSNASWRVTFCENVGKIWNFFCNRPASTKWLKYDSVDSKTEISLHKFPSFQFLISRKQLQEIKFAIGKPPFVPLGCWLLHHSTVIQTGSFWQIVSTH